MRRFPIATLVLLTLLSSVPVIADEADEADASEEEPEEEEEIDEQDNYVSQVQICSDSIVQVQGVSIVCDSPGTYYYGSGKYRDNPSCVPGDKAKVEIDFYITDPDVIEQSGGYVLADVSVDGGWWKESKTLYEGADLCNMETLKSKSGTACPAEGYYKIKTRFYWAETSNQAKFYPVVTVGFKSNENKNVYDYGGANTNLCRGSTFVTWNDSVKISYANALANFMISFGILFCTIGVMGVLIWFLAKRPKPIEMVRKIIPQKKKESPVDEEFDFRKMKSVGNQDLFDF